MQFAPYLLDASVPPEGRPQPPSANLKSEPRVYMEARGEALGLRFSEGRTMRSSSMLSLQAAEFAADHGDCAEVFHRRVFDAYFDELQDIGDLDTIVRLGEESGLPGDELRQALQD